MTSGERVIAQRARDSYAELLGQAAKDPQPKPKPKPQPSNAMLLLFWMAVIYAGYRVIRQATATRFER